jgi:hypothetical protein
MMATFSPGKMVRMNYSLEKLASKCSITEKMEMIAIVEGSW